MAVPNLRWEIQRIGRSKNSNFEENRVGEHHKRVAVLMGGWTTEASGKQG